jgi:hypothetical protein
MDYIVNHSNRVQVTVSFSSLTIQIYGVQS